MNTFKLNILICSIILLLFSTVAHVTVASGQINRKPDINTKTEASDFSKEPVKFLAEIYAHYHNWQLDKGINKTTAALEIINKIYSNDPDSKLSDPKLKTNKAYQVKSTLHTMLGMLYHRKSLSSDDLDKEKYGQLFKKLERGGKVTHEDLDRLKKDLDKSRASNKSNDYLKVSREELTRATEIDPLNPTPHYFLGNIYSAMAVVGDTSEAEKEYFIAAKLSINEGNKLSAMRVVETIRKINPDSEYITRIEGLLAEGGHGE